MSQVHGNVPGPMRSSAIGTNFLTPEEKRAGWTLAADCKGVVRFRFGHNLNASCDVNHFWTQWESAISDLSRCIRWPCTISIQEGAGLRPGIDCLQVVYENRPWGGRSVTVRLPKSAVMSRGGC